jgi:putative DNA primase/helicase
MNTDSLIRAVAARRSGSSWVAKCPSHDDRTPSLSIRDADGKALFYCHAGCSQENVIEALRARGLWEPGPEKSGLSPRIVATYGYCDERGDLLYQTVRYDPKDFKQRCPDGRGGWIWKKGPRQVLYRLPEVLEAPIVFVAEGEKDVETLRDQGFVATTNAGGANAQWLPEFTNTLRAREVILLPDADEPGRRRVLLIARALLGYAAKIIVLELEGAHDVTEWFERGHSEIELIARVEVTE